MTPSTNLKTGYLLTKAFWIAYFNSLIHNCYDGKMEPRCYISKSKNLDEILTEDNQDAIYMTDKICERIRECYKQLDHLRSHPGLTPRPTTRHKVKLKQTLRPRGTHTLRTIMMMTLL